MDQYMYEHIFKVDKKEKWMNKKEAFLVAKPSPKRGRYLQKSREEKSRKNNSRYVSPTDMKFRETNKKLFTDKKNEFKVKNGKDYLIKAGEEYNEKFYLANLS